MDIIKKNINDILDINGKENNFLTGLPYSDEYKTLAKSWCKLPLYDDKNKVKDFFNLLDTKQVILLISGTGSGKTVLVPKYFLKYITLLNINKKIAMTNPKILTTYYNAEYGAKTLDVKLGEQVGYKYKGAKKNSTSPDTKLLYVTDGLILSIMYGDDKLLSDYAGIIIDEAHERSIQIDLLLKLLKDIILVRKDFKLIIMSATINSETFRNYFNIKNIKYGEIEISGKSNYDIQQNWLEPQIKISRGNYMNYAISKCLEILKTTKTGDIIVFVATQKEALDGCKTLKLECPLKINKSICNELFCVEVFSKMKKENKELATSKDLYKNNTKYNRKIIFATNVAESSITFEGLVYVVDTGFELLKYYDSKYNSNIITKAYTTQAQIKQRIGRAGRTQPGISYHLYSKDSYDKFKIYPEPNIIITDLTEQVLSLVNYSTTIKIFVKQLIDFITIPTIEQIINSIYKLYFVKAIKLIDNNDKLLDIHDIKWSRIKSIDDISNIFNGSLTSLGLTILKFKSSYLLNAYAILLSKYINCQREIIDLIAILEITDGKLDMLFNYNKKEESRIIKYFNKYSIKNSDHLTILNIYYKLFCEKIDVYLNISEFKKIKERSRQLKSYVQSIDNDILTQIKNKYLDLTDIVINKNTNINIISVLSKAFSYNLIKKHNKKEFISTNFLINSIAEIDHFKFTKINKNKSNYAICNTLSDTFGKKSFQCITYLI